MLGEWEGLISSLVKLDKSGNLEGHSNDKSGNPEKLNSLNKLDEARSPLHEQINTLCKENPGKKNSEPAQLYRSQQIVEEDVQRGGKKTSCGGGEKRQRIHQ